MVCPPGVRGSIESAEADMRYLWGGPTGVPCYAYEHLHAPHMVSTVCWPLHEV